MRPQGFRTGSFAQFVPDEVSGTLDCRHMTCTAQGMPCLAVDAPANVANTLLRRFDGSPRPEIGGGNIIAAAPASFDPYEPGGIKTVREDGAANTVINGTCPGNHGAAVQRVTNSNGGDVAPTPSVTDLVKQFTGQADNGGGYVCATIENHQCGSQVREADVAGTMGASRNAQAANNNPLVVATPAPDTFVKVRHARSAEDDERWAAESVAGTRNVHDGERPQEVVVEKPTPAVCYDGYNQRAHEEVSMTLRSAATGTDGNDADPKVCIQPVGLKDNAGARARSCGEAVGIMPSLTTDCGIHQSVAVPTAYGMNPQASLMHPCTEGVAQTLAVSHEGGVVQPRRSTCLTPGDPIQKRVYTADGPAPTLQSIAEGSGVSAQAFVLPQDADGLPEVVVRRLTPTECERLMGLPDGWTRVTFTPDQIADPAIVAYFRRVHDDWQKMIAEDGKTPKPKTEAFVRDWLAKISDPATCPDAPRFKVCGNGWATNCPRWILLNLLRAEGIDPWYGEDGV